MALFAGAIKGHTLEMRIAEDGTSKGAADMTVGTVKEA